ncbi:MAG: hypothetical protein WCS90_03185 [Bacilli bacterium]
MHKRELRFIFLLSFFGLLLPSCQKPSVSSTNSLSGSSQTTSSWDGKRIVDNRGLSAEQYTRMNTVGTDGLGRELNAGDSENSRQVGMFYFLWHGAHETGIYDITQLLANDPDDLWSLEDNPASPINAFHYWGEPLYGYYRSEDPWILARHLELLTMAGVDYLVFDTTNAVIYADTVDALCETFIAAQKQGWKVPKIAFYTNSSSASTLSSIYERWYKNYRYSSLWYSVNDKPLIIGVSSSLDDAHYALFEDFFTFKESQWPTMRPNKKEGFPWMDWDYPQTNYNGTMSVSLAQHPGSAMSQQALSNWGRGFDFKLFKNKSDNVNQGTNFQGEWDTVFSSLGTDNEVSNAFVTGWNEWMAVKQKLSVDVPVFCDTFNEEYSRDIEMMKGGYGDNYYLQLAENVRRFKCGEARHYVYDEKTIAVDDFASGQWDNVKAVYLDMAGDALKRDFDNCCRSAKYTDDSARNDIMKTSVTHDASSLYLKIDCLNAITPLIAGDTSWMNVLFDSCQEANVKFAHNFDFIIRTYSPDGKAILEKRGEQGWISAGEARYAYQGKTLQIAIPLASLSLKESAAHVRLKVSDHVSTPEDIADYYVSGDSAPIGRLAYEYGY